MIRQGVILGKRYVIQERIGMGGMAEVYRANDLKLNRLVAVKVLKKEYREDETFVRKFQVEAQAAAGLMHPNIVNVYDVGEDRGLYYIVMELVEGITLKDYIEKKEILSARETISIAIQICTGLLAAHRKHIVHRDIKPQNVIISKEGKVKVTDFGIAKATTSNTISSNVMGSVHYTSPEQARGGFSDEKSDIYSTGITLYEMVTGRVPFDGDSTVSIALQHLQEGIIPPSEFVDLPYSLEQIILKCTQKSADRRYPDMEALILDLKRALVDPEGDFVDNGYRRSDETVAITSGELRRIQEEYEDRYDDDDDYDDDDESQDDQDANDEEVDPKMARLMKIMKIVVAVIVALTLLFVVGKVTGILKVPNAGTQETNKAKVKVPDVLGKTQAEAEELLKAKGLKVSVTEAKSDDHEEGQVIKTDPEVGKRIEKGTTVVITVCSGEKGKEVTVPQLKNESEESATKALDKLGFTKITPQLKASDEVEEGLVIETNPKAGETVVITKDKEAEIIIYISSGKEQVEMPQLVGKSKDEATKIASEKGLTLNVAEEKYSDKEAGTVLEQDVEHGKKVAKGTTINIIISKGKDMAYMPDIFGTSVSSARSMIESAGLKVGETTYENSEAASGRIIRATSENGEELKTGAPLEKGSKVNIVVSKGPDSSEPTPDPGDGNSGEENGNGNGSTF